MSRNNHPLEPRLTRLEKFWLFETFSFYFLVGFDNLETSFRMLKINRTIEKPQSLADIVHEDKLTFTKEEINEILEMVNEGNKTSGGLKKVCTGCGFVGFVKFLDCYYFTLITQKKEVGCIAGNFIYSVKATEMFSVRAKSDPDSNVFTNIWKKLNKRLSQTSSEIAESRYMGLFQFVDMSKDFFFSYTYDLTHSLQRNYVAFSSDSKGPPPRAQEMYEWNHYQTEALRGIVGESGFCQWIVPIIHGSYQQKRFTTFGKIVDLIVLARRSRHYAGTRYLKRGVSVHGKTANDVEIEQIIQHEDGYRSNFCSYLQMRGSIPTYWYQETSVTMPKPPILINRVDPDYHATMEHFADLFRRYSSPVIVLDLVKQQEKRARESIVGKEFRHAVEVLNECITTDHKIRYIALDYSRITSIAKGKAKGAAGAKGNKKGTRGSGAGSGGGQSERAMAVVGDEWAMMESALVKEKSIGDLAEYDSTKSAVGASVRASPSGKGPPMDSVGRPRSSDATGGMGEPELDRVDVLRELEDIAAYTLAETSFFCNTLSFMDNVPLVTKEKRKQAEDRGGYMEQRGVLRTNCIDCLDRTNGGQFAVAMKFLSLSLHSLGIFSPGQTLEPTSQMLLALMDMYGEMGDKIALQYGGSEAHKKVLAGKSGNANSSSKQSELLTSIKRYYSNAFTDMVKQDAMNVFLGCFVPSESDTPLWDLDSDYHLHNTELHPPSPYVLRVLFDDICRISKTLRATVVTRSIENTVMTALLEDKKQGLQLFDSILKREKLDPKLEAELAVLVKEIEEMIELLPVPEVDLKRIAQRYFIKSMRMLAAGETPTTEGNNNSTTPKFRSKTALQTSIKSIARLERRKYFRKIVAKRVSNSAKAWWQQALLEHEKNLYDSGPGSSPFGNELPNLNYFRRVYQPDRLSEFDDLLSLECYLPIDAVDSEKNSNVHVHEQTTARPLKREGSHTRSNSIRSDGSSEGGNSSPDNTHHNSFHPHNTHAVTTANTGMLGTIDEMGYYDPNGGGSARSSNDEVQGGFHLGRYVREIGLKARTVFGGFLRREDQSATPVYTSKQSMKRQIQEHDWNNRFQHINHHAHHVPKSSTLMYTRYVQIFNNHLILMEDKGASRNAEEEYYILLRDHNISVDNVVGMEHLSIKSFVSTEINEGIYRGMKQNDSAFLAHGFLLTSLVYIEGELQKQNKLEIENPDSFVPSRSSPTQLMNNSKTFFPPVATSFTPPEPLSPTTQQIHNLNPFPPSTPFFTPISTKVNQHEGMMSLFYNPNTPKKNSGSELPVETQKKIERCFQRSLGRGKRIPLGLEREFKKIAKEYVDQQQYYQREISESKLNNRLGAMTDEKSILDYSVMFDPDTLASDLDTISFIANDSPFVETYTELGTLMASLTPTYQNIKEKLRQKLEEKKETSMDVRQVEKSPVSGSPSDESISAQLGLKMPGLADDLATDYSLDSPFCLPYPYDKEVRQYKSENKDYEGFAQLSSDLYARMSNPYLHMNEICVSRYSEIVSGKL